MDSISLKPKKIIRRYIKKIEPFIKVEKVILFGSWARGEGGVDSDIDFIILSPDFKKMNFMERLIWLSKMRGEDFMSPGMDIFGYTSQEFKKLSNESLILGAARKEGVVLK